MGIEEANPEILKRIFRQRIIDEDTGCWLWTGSVDSEGRAQLSWGGRSNNQAVARWVLGINPGDEICVLHKNECHNLRCFNPSHLYLGNRQDNTRDIVEFGNHNMARKTHCPQGHEYSDNVRNNQGARICKICRWEFYKKRRDLKKLKEGS